MPVFTTASRVSILVSAALSCLLSSCAVLMVDVDVYKGPLMNQESIQMEQLVPLAEGALPLLTHLRDDLEWQDDGRVPDAAAEWYKPGYVQPSLKLPGKRCFFDWIFFFSECSKKGTAGFINPLARRVNDILVWYEPAGNAPEKKDGDTTKNQSENGLTGGGLREKIAEYRRIKENKNIQPPPAAGAQPQQDALMAHREALIQSLVPFAAKILFLANHEGLSALPETTGLVSGGVGNLSRGLLGDTVTETFSPMIAMDNLLGKGTLAGRKRIQYVRLLQAVGNSILLLANELREQAEARKGGDIRAKAEKAAIEVAFDGDPSRVYVKLVQELGEEIKGQNSLVESLQRQFDKIVQDMNNLEKEAEKKNDSGEWSKNREAEKKKYDQLEGALKLIEPDELTPALGKLTQAPESLADAWAKILLQVQSILKDNEISTNAKEYLDSVKGKMDLESAAKISYVKVWEAVKVYLGGKRETLSDIEIERKKFDSLIALFGAKEAKSGQKIEAGERKEALEITEKVVKTEKGAVLYRLASQDVFVSGRGVYLILAMHLRDKLEKDKNQKDVQTTLDELNKRVPPPSFTISDTSTLTDAKAVLDQEIAFLRQEHIQAVRVGGGGENTVAVEKALAVLEAAAQHRAGMVHLRPAAAYLRTSYPSTSLQDDPNLTWDNLLLQQGLRNIPFSSYVADLFNPESRHDRAVSADLDKQYWQNINRVRVSGAGSTNYVLAKDDVGNWYVKHYFGDTARIFESARKLGMYNLGSTMGASLLSSLKDKQVKEESSSVDAQPIPLKRVFDQHRTAYTSKTTADVTALKELAEKDVLATKIKEGWQSLPDLKGEGETLKMIEDGLPAPLKKLKDRMGEIEGNDKTRDGVRVVQEIQAIRNFHRALNAGVESLDLPIPTTGSLMLAKKEVEALKKAMTEACRAAGLPTNDCLTATEQKNVAEREFKANKTNHDRTVKGRAEKVVVDVLQEELSGLVQSRQRLLQDYEQAILFVGDASKN